MPRRLRCRMRTGTLPTLTLTRSRTTVTVRRTGGPAVSAAQEVRLRARRLTLRLPARPRLPALAPPHLAGHLLPRGPLLPRVATLRTWEAAAPLQAERALAAAQATRRTRRRRRCATPAPRATRASHGPQPRAVPPARASALVAQPWLTTTTPAATRASCRSCPRTRKHPVAGVAPVGMRRPRARRTRCSSAQPWGRHLASPCGRSTPAWMPSSWPRSRHRAPLPTPRLRCPALGASPVAVPRLRQAPPPHRWTPGRCWLACAPLPRLPTSTPRSLKRCERRLGVTATQRRASQDCSSWSAGPCRACRLRPGSRLRRHHLRLRLRHRHHRHRNRLRHRPRHRPRPRLLLCPRAWLRRWRRC